MSISRNEPSTTAAERDMLEGWLDYHRATLLTKCEQLSDDQLRRRAVATSNLSLLGLVRHMVEVERQWFYEVMTGVHTERGIYWTPQDPDGDFDNVDTADVTDAFTQFDTACQLSRDIAGRIDSLDELSELEKRGRRFNLRWVYGHMIEEYARHNGHADLIREAIDGKTGE